MDNKEMFVCVRVCVRVQCIGVELLDFVYVRKKGIILEKKKFVIPNIGV